MNGGDLQFRATRAALRAAYGRNMFICRPGDEDYEGTGFLFGVELAGERHIFGRGETLRVAVETALDHHMRAVEVAKLGSVMLWANRRRVRLMRDLLARYPSSASTDGGEA